MLVRCCTSVSDAGPTLNQHWVNALCFCVFENSAMPKWLAIKRQAGVGDEAHRGHTWIIWALWRIIVDFTDCTRLRWIVPIPPQYLSTISRLSWYYRLERRGDTSAQRLPPGLVRREDIRLYGEAAMAAGTLWVGLFIHPRSNNYLIKANRRILFSSI